MIERYEASNVIFCLKYFKDVSDSSIFRFEKFSQFQINHRVIDYRSTKVSLRLICKANRIKLTSLDDAYFFFIYLCEKIFKCNSIMFDELYRYYFYTLDFELVLFEYSIRIGKLFIRKFVLHVSLSFVKYMNEMK